MSHLCPFCSSSESKLSYLPDTFFNRKNFSYIQCKNCNLIYLTPFPTQEDYVFMYPPSYQSGINTKIIENEKLAGLRFPYSKHFELINKFSPGKKILDYGCGSANFVLNAHKKGFACDGVEYNSAHIDILIKEIPGGNFYLIDDFLKSTILKYDVIRLSNVLEHLDNPNGVIQILTKKLNPKGILLVEGPIETNTNLAFLFRRTYFQLYKLINKNRKATHSPTHIFFSNAVNQKEFFKQNKLSELHFEVTECEWPFPENFSEVKSVGSFFKWMIAKKSKLISHFAKNWGNTFIYVGKN
jgi:2-polyprenyl-3-methyl-5-hydroxy-6-metoxy-1,4-benzoquinol methylase